MFLENWMKSLSELTGVTEKIKRKSTQKVFLVYQMGKVGSMTIESSLKKAFINDQDVEILHLHEIGGDYRKEKQGNYFFYSKDWKEKLRLKLGQLIRSFYKNKFLKILNSKKEVNIITIVRDPISRNISALFQALEFMKEGKQRSQITIEELERLFYLKVNHKGPEEWFDYELKKNFNINIYDYEFDIQKRCLMINKGNLKLLVIRLEDLNKTENIITNFLGVKNFKIIDKNISGIKWYSEIYSAFKGAFKPSKEYLDKYLDTKFTRHFYSAEEINKIYKKYKY